MIDLVNKIFESARSSHIPFVFIRPKDIKEPDIYQGDFDLLVKPDALNSFLYAVHKCCSDSCINFRINRVKKEKTALILFSHNSKKTVEFDLWTELDIKDPYFPKSTYISWDNLEKTGNLYSVNNEFSLKHDFSALFYLSHLYSKNKNINNIEVRNRLDFYSNLENLSTSITNLLSEVSTDKMREANQRLKSKGLLSYSKMHRFIKIMYRVKNDTSKKSGIIAVIGPDGVGKTTIINKLEDIYNARYFRFKKLFRKSFIYKILLMLTKRNLENKHNSSLEKNQFDDLQYSKLFWISLLHGYILSVMTRFGKNRIFDRYYMDLLITGSRFSNQDLKTHPNSHYLINVAPTPYCIIQLDAPSELILERKEELSFSAIDQFRTKYFELSLASKTPIIIYINTKNSINDTFEFLSNLELYS